MASAGSIFVDLLLRDAKYVSGLNRARGSTNKFSKDASNAFASVISPVNNLSNAIMGLGATLAASFSVDKLIKYSDTWKQLESRLGLVINQSESMVGVQSELFDIATRTRQPLDGVYNLYTKLKTSVPEAQRAQYDFLGVTESINSALAITGEGSAQAASAILQFAQASASDFKGSAQEINSLIDSAPRLALALQKSFGDGTKSLKDLSKEGELSRDVIFRSLSGMGEEGQRLREELAKIPPTVGQAFTELNNAFLVFIGQNESASISANSFGIAVRFAAENLDVIVKTIIALSAVLTARLIPGIAATVIGFTSATQQAIAYQLALARMSGISTAAAAATIGLGAALRGVLLMVGGPFGAAFLAAGAAIYYLTTAMTDQEKVSQSFAKSGNDIEVLYSKLTFASKEREKEIRKEISALFDLQVAEVSATKARLDRLQSMGKLGRAFWDPAGINEEKLTERLNAQQSALKDLEDYILNKNRPSGGAYSPTSSGGVSKEGKKRLDELQNLYQKYESVIRGVTDETIRLENAEKELNELRRTGKITQEEMTVALERYKDGLGGTNSQMDEFAKNAAQNLQNTFKDFFMSSEKGFKGMRESFANMLREMVANAAAANLTRILFGQEQKGGGRSGGILDGLLGSLGSSFSGFFADGGYIEPGKWGIAGEAGAEAIYGGKTGATVVPQSGGNRNVYNIDARGTDPSVVTRLESTIMALAGPGVIESRVGNAQMRGSL